jgi:hypothetical protein
MVIVLDHLNHGKGISIQSEATVLAQSHNIVMSSLDSLHLASMEQLVSLEKRVNTFLKDQQMQSDGALQRVRFLLAAVASLAVAITAIMWIFAKNKVSGPIMQVFQESQNIDMWKI